MTDKLHRNVSSMKSVHAHFSIGDEEWDRFEDAMPPAISPRPPIEELRAQSTRMAKLTAERSTAKTGLKVTERSIPANGTDILVRIYIPDSEDANHLFPLLFYMHGGGFSLGNLDSADDMCRTLCVKKNISVINIDYRLAPEFPFPVGLNDSFDALKWAVGNAPELKADPKLGLIVGGASSGANFAAVLTFMVQDDDFFASTPITGQILQIPKTCAPEVYPESYKSELQSRWDLLDAPLLNDEAIKQFKSFYVSADYDPMDVRISPLVAPSHKGLPAAYFQIAGKDPLRDEGIVYQKVLDTSGVPTRIDIYSGVPHGFSYIRQLKAAEKSRSDLEFGVQWLLDQGKTKISK